MEKTEILLETEQKLPPLGKALRPAPTPKAKQKTSLAQAGIDTDDITYVVPHLSSMFFYKILEQEFQKRNIDLPTTKWFTNLSSVGNIGAASPFVALNGLIETKCLKKGDTILLIVPESGRFSCGTALLKYV